MKIAIVHDDLMRKGGAEQVFLSMLRAFPSAEAYTLCYNPTLTYSEFKNFKINTSWFQGIAKTEKGMKTLFFPFGIWAMKSLDLSSFDVVLISTTFCGKYIKTKPGTAIITYCHTPFRLAWYPETYKFYKANKLKQLSSKWMLHILKHIDKKYALKTHYFIANSKVISKRIEDCYTKLIPISIIHPPVRLDRFYVSEGLKNYYLVVSRFQLYKKIDLVVDAFNEMPEKKLIIVGTGILERKIRSAAKKNIEFRGSVDSETLAYLYSNCKAFIFPQMEDFGITPLEANASGRPVIAFGAGGVLETMIPYTNETDKFSAVFFEQQTVEDLKQAVQKFEELENIVDPKFNVDNANRFCEPRFIKQIQEFIESLPGQLMKNSPA